ncbi:hypothetical protein Tco_0785130 [Tanacetum coccineum]
MPGRKSKSQSRRRNKSKVGRKEQELVGRALLSEVNLVQNNEALEINLDLLEEKREQAAIREAKSEAKMEKYYNSKVQSTRFMRESCVPVTTMQAVQKIQGS